MIFEKPTEEFFQFRIPGLVITEKGVLFACCECRRYYEGNHDWSMIDLRVKRSADQGKTWETVHTVESGGNTMNNPVLIVRGEELHFLYCENYGQLFHCVSTDGGNSWSAAEEITEPFENCGFSFSVLAVGPGHGIVHKGKLLIPVWFAHNPEDPKAHAPSFISTLYSEDGSHWKLGEVLGRGQLPNASECALAVTKENKVLISIRNESKLRALAVSETGYDGWENLHLEGNLPDPVCQGSMCYENGTIYHSNCCNTEVREDLTVKVSRDDFATFESIYVDKIAGYSDIAVQNGRLYVLYEQRWGSDGLHFQVIEV